MKAEEVRVERLFAAGQQLRIPVWQRRYSWDRQDWAELWDDIERANAPGAGPHFLGSFVLKALPWTGLPSEARQFWVVDGQQRLTTLTVLLAALRDAIGASFSDVDDAQAEVEAFTKQLLRNADLAEGHRSRLVLQDIDDSRLALIVAGTTDRLGRTPIDGAYQYFVDKLRSFDGPQLHSLLASLLTKLDCVWVTLQDGDNAHRVFQTLNAGGKPLRQSDLVRNYFFLLLGEFGEEFYETRWRHLEQMLSSSSLEDYFVAWSITRKHSGGKQSLFKYFQVDLGRYEQEPDRVRGYGEALTASAREFATIKGTRKAAAGSIERCLEDLRRWGTVPADGLLLFVMDALVRGRLDEESGARSLSTVLSFMARRFLAGFEPNLHKSIFVRTTHRLIARDDLADSSLADYLRYVLSSGTDVRTWPSDEVLRERIRLTSLYTRTRQRWVFSVLDQANRQSFENSGHVPALPAYGTYTIEHVMPQTLTEEWEADLRSWGVSDPTRLHQDRRHVLGNLTLSPVNSQLSNKRFSDKRSLLQDDWLRLNTELSSLESWTEVTINERSSSLLNRLLDAFVAPMTAEEMDQSPFQDAQEIATEADEDASEDE